MYQRMKNPRQYQDEIQGWLTLYEKNKALEPQDKKKSLKEMIFPEYHEFLQLFEKAAADNFPPHWPYNHQFPLKEGFMPPYKPIYVRSQPELNELR